MASERGTPDAIGPIDGDGKYPHWSLIEAEIDLHRAHPAFNMEEMPIDENGLENIAHLKRGDGTVAHMAEAHDFENAAHEEGKVCFAPHVAYGIITDPMASVFV